MAEWLLSVCEALCGIGFVWIVLLLSEQSVFLQLLSHIMLDSLGLRAGVVVSISLQQVDAAPNGEAGTDSDYKGL